MGDAKDGTLPRIRIDPRVLRTHGQRSSSARNVTGNVDVGPVYRVQVYELSRVWVEILKRSRVERRGVAHWVKAKV